MSFDLNDLLDRGGALADSAKRTAADLAQRGKRQLDLTAAQSRLAKAQRQLGALVYSLVRSGEHNDTLVQKYVDAIAKVEAEIDALRADGAAPAAPAAGAAPHLCPQCGAEVEPDAIFCNNCGAQL